MHFLPYAWLQRSNAYRILGFALSVGAFAIQLLMGGRAFSFILLFVSVSYWVGAFMVRRDADQLLSN